MSYYLAKLCSWFCCLLPARFCDWLGSGLGKLTWVLVPERRKTMRQEQPDLLVLIDYPDFNWRLAAKAKELGIPVFSYIPPSAWAWRKGRAKKCAVLADELAAIFPFELPVYKAAGANITFQGNPLVDTVKLSMERETAKQYFGLEAGERAVLLLPGSRPQEIRLLLPVMLAAARRIQEDAPDMVYS